MRHLQSELLTKQRSHVFYLRRLGQPDSSIYHHLDLLHDVRGNTSQSRITRVKQAAHWHEFCSCNAPHYGLPSGVILVTASLSRRQGERTAYICVTSCHLSRISYELLTKCMTPNVTHVQFVVTSRDTLEIKFLNISKFSPRLGTHYFTRPASPRIPTHHHVHCHELFLHWQRQIACQCEACFNDVKRP